MPTTALPRGRGTRVRVAVESSFGVAETTGFTELNVYSHDFRRKRALQADDVLGAGFANDVDARPAAPDVEEGEFTVSIPADGAQMGYWLRYALGAPTTTGTTPKVHTFVSGVTTIPSLTIERMLKSGQFEMATGCVITSIKFPFGPGPGYREIEISGVCARVSEPYASTLAGSPTVAALTTRFAKTVGTCKVATAAIGKVFSGSLTVNFAVTLDRFVGGGDYPSQAFLEGIDAMIDASVRYDTDAIRNYANLTSGLPSAMRWDQEFVVSASLSLVLTCKAVRFEPMNAPVSNGGAITHDLKGRAEVGAADPLITIVLTNSVSGYP